MAYLSQPATTADIGLVVIGPNIDVDPAGSISIPQSVAPTSNVTFNKIQAANDVSIAGKIDTIGNITTIGNVYGNKVYDNNKEVITTVTPTAGPGITITGLTTTGPDVSFTISSSGADIINTRTVTTNYTATATDEYIGVNSTTTTTITLPVGVNGRNYTITDEHGTGLGKIIVQPSTSEKINGAATYSIVNAYQSVTVVFNSGSWHII